jgi:hypothetical protein
MNTCASIHHVLIHACHLMLTHPCGCQNSTADGDSRTTNDRGQNPSYSQRQLSRCHFVCWNPIWTAWNWTQASLVNADDYLSCVAQRLTRIFAVTGTKATFLFCSWAALFCSVWHKHCVKYILLPVQGLPLCWPWLFMMRWVIIVFVLFLCICWNKHCVQVLLHGTWMMLNSVRPLGRTKRWMPYKQKMVVCCDSHKVHTNKVCVQSTWLYVY